MKTRPGHPIVDDTMLLLLNAHHLPLSFVLPAHRRGVCWEPVVDTQTAAVPAGVGRHLRGCAPYVLEGRSLALLRLSPKTEAVSPPRRSQRPAPPPGGRT